MKLLVSLPCGAMALTALFMVGAAAFGAEDDDEVARAVDGFAVELGGRGVLDAGGVRRVLAGARYEQEIVARISRPVERTLDWAAYRRIFLGEDRVAEGAAFLAAHRETLERAERRFGVPPEYVVAILGVETRFGTRLGDWRVLDALYTLAFHYPARARFFRGELEALLLLAAEEGRDPGSLRGSYAGAMGWGQFIPSSYRAYAIDFDDDGARDIWANPVDAIGSIANYFARHGWRAGGEVTRRVSADREATLDGVANSGLDLAARVGTLRARGVRGLEGLAEDRAVGLWQVQGAEGEELYVTFDNFRTITRYNHSHLYALAVHDLAQAIARAAGGAS